MSILSYNGAAIIAMAGKDCVGIACDTRLGMQAQTVAMDFQKVFRVNDRIFLGLAGLGTDVQTISQLLKFKVNMYKMDEEREIKPKTFSALVSNMMYEKRFGPYFVEPVIAGLTAENQPFLSSMDCLGCEMMTKDFVVAGTMEDALYGMCESLYRPDMEAEDLFETLSQCLLSACNRDALAGWGGVVHIITPKGVTSKKLKKQRGDGDAAGAGAAAPSNAASDEPALPWGMQPQAMQPSSLARLTDDKLARFALGQQRKTKFEKEREEREARKRQADEEAAQMYATFVASFEDEDATLGKAFVRAGGAPTTGEANAAARAELYRLRPAPSPAGGGFRVGPGAFHSAGSAAGPKPSEMARMLGEMTQSDAGSSTAGPPTKKRRDIDQFLEELKEREPVAPTMDEMGLGKGSFDHGDPSTTNLYVGNLAPTVTEETLETLFGKFGDVFSVKIMWPRTEEERARRRNCGFVSFFDRRDADEARTALHDTETNGESVTLLLSAHTLKLEGFAMIVGWGKAVKIDASRRRGAKPAPVAALAHPAPLLPAVARTGIGSGSIAVHSAIPPIVVEAPADPALRARVDLLARYVATDGVQFENAVRARETRASSEFAFLFEAQTPLATYYRWRVFAFAMGDDEDSWRDAPFQMTVDGPAVDPTELEPEFQSTALVIGVAARAEPQPEHTAQRLSLEQQESQLESQTPPPQRFSVVGQELSEATPSRRQQQRQQRRVRQQELVAPSLSLVVAVAIAGPRGSGDRGSTTVAASALLTGQQIARAREVERGWGSNRLADAEYAELRALLAGMTLERESVKTAMGFALDHSEAAVDIVGGVLKAFQRADASAVALVGYLYLTSDILHNSSAGVKNASLFRTTFQDCLPEILERLRVAHKALTGRMSANAMKDKVLAVLTAWESWSLFPPMFLVGLNATFLRKVEESEYAAAVAGDRKAPTADALGVDEERLRKTCRQAGILATGDAKQMLLRLQWLNDFTAPKAPTTDGSATMAATASEATGRREATRVDSADDIDGEPIDDGAGVDSEDLDGAPIDDDEDSDESKETLDGEPLDTRADGDVDGEPLECADEEDLDGVPLDEEDLDGEPM
ncbi:hypothetical protein PybrP1_002413 [[Pythium] brassicae (nom. inval.)]|nr:hypothetical protein PybrP1_002413 [[Pythium] brassicae (nom. inval.)]